MNDVDLEQELAEYEFEQGFVPDDALGSELVLPALDATPKSQSRPAREDDSRAAEATTPAPRATQGRSA